MYLLTDSVQYLSTMLETARQFKQNHEKYDCFNNKKNLWIYIKHPNLFFFRIKTGNFNNDDKSARDIIP